MSKAKQREHVPSEEHDYPFMVERADGELRTMILYTPSSGTFYEPLPKGHELVDPDTALTLRCPRDNDTFDYTGGKVHHTFQDMLGNNVREFLPVEEWCEFRETLVNADESDYERARETLVELFEEAREN